MVIYLAGLQGIPKQLYEAASIDGANSWMSFWHVTIPMLSPTIFFTLVIGIIGSFQAFTQAYVMTSGGPVNSTLFFVYCLSYFWFLLLHSLEYHQGGFSMKATPADRRLSYE